MILINEATVKLVLEALKMVDRDDNDRDFLFPSQCYQLDEAIIALEQVLAEQPAQQQEPVAWFDSQGKIHGRVSKEQLVALCFDALSQLEEKCVPMRNHQELQALVSRQGIRLMEYESEQAPRPWVGLTDEDIGAACGFAEHTTASTRFTLMAISRAIEAKLKEKNNG